MVCAANIAAAITLAFANLAPLAPPAPAPVVTAFAPTAGAHPTLLAYEHVPGDDNIICRSTQALPTAYLPDNPNVTVLVPKLQPHSTESSWGNQPDLVVINTSTAAIKHNLPTSYDPAIIEMHTHADAQLYHCLTELVNSYSTEIMPADSKSVDCHFIKIIKVDHQSHWASVNKLMMNTKTESDTRATTAHARDNLGSLDAHKAPLNGSDIKVFNPGIRGLPTLMARSEATHQIKFNSDDPTTILVLLAHCKGLQEGRRPGSGNVAWKGTVAPKDGEASSKMVGTTTFTKAATALAKTKGEDRKSINLNHKRPIQTEMKESAEAPCFTVSSFFQVSIDGWTRIAVRLYDGSASFNPATMCTRRLTSWRPSCVCCLRFNCLWLILGVGDLTGPLSACCWLNMHNSWLKNNAFTVSFPTGNMRKLLALVIDNEGKMPIWQSIVQLLTGTVDIQANSPTTLAQSFVNDHNLHINPFAKVNHVTILNFSPSTKTPFWGATDENFLTSFALAEYTFLVQLSQPKLIFPNDRCQQIRRGDEVLQCNRQFRSAILHPGEMTPLATNSELLAEEMSDAHTAHIAVTNNHEGGALILHPGLTTLPASKSKLLNKEVADAAHIAAAINHEGGGTPTSATTNLRYRVSQRAAGQAICRAPQCYACHHGKTCKEPKQGILPKRLANCRVPQRTACQAVFRVPQCDACHSGPQCYACHHGKTCKEPKQGILPKRLANCRVPQRTACQAVFRVPQCDACHSGTVSKTPHQADCHVRQAAYQHGNDPKYGKLSLATMAGPVVFCAPQCATCHDGKASKAPKQMAKKGVPPKRQTISRVPQYKPGHLLPARHPVKATGQLPRPSGRRMSGRLPKASVRGMPVWQSIQGATINDQAKHPAKAIGHLPRFSVRCHTPCRDHRP
jgi:hypothetical protein